MNIKLYLTGKHAIIVIFLSMFGSFEVLDSISNYFNINNYILKILFTIFILIFVKVSKIKGEK